MLNLITGIDQKKLILIILISVAVLYVDVSYVLKFQFDCIAGMGPKIEKVRKDIDGFKKDEANVESLKKLPPQQLSGPLKNKKFFTPEQVPMILETISDVANKNSVKIMQISASSEVKAKETAKTSKGQKASVEAPSQSFLITMELYSDYHHFGSFLSDLDYSRVISSVQEFKITSDQDNIMKQNIKLLLKAYVKK